MAIKSVKISLIKISRSEAIGLKWSAIDFDAKKKFTEELVKMIKETTNIEINDVYVSFDEYPNWGKQGTLFQ